MRNNSVFQDAFGFWKVSLAKFLGQIQYQIIVYAVVLVGIALLSAVPNAGAVQNVTTLVLHALGSAVAAVQANAQVNGVGVAAGDFLGHIH